MPRPPRTPAPRQTVAVAPAIVHEVLALAGAALPADVQTSARRRLDFDPAHIRIHTDGHAAASAAAVGARAYTVGRHIAFAADAFAPHTPAGRALLDHELRHAAEQQLAPIPGRGALLVDAEPAHERPAELAEHGAWSTPRPVHRAVLQRAVEARTREAAPEIAARIRRIHARDGVEAALRELMTLPPGTGPELVKADPLLRRQIAGTAINLSARIDALAILSGVSLTAPHVLVAHQVGGGLLGRTIVQLSRTHDPRRIEADFNRDFTDAFFNVPLLRHLGVGAFGPDLNFNTDDGLIHRNYADNLHACMVLDHTPIDVELAGVRLAAGHPTEFLGPLRTAAAHGDDLDGLAAFAERWDRHVRRRQGWTRRGIVEHDWCTLDLKQTVIRHVDEGPRLQVLAYFDALDARQRERDADASFAALVRQFGRAGAHQKLAERFQAILSPQADHGIILGRFITSRVNSTVATLLAEMRYLNADDIRAVDRVYTRNYGRTIADALRLLPPTNAEFFNVLGLLALGTFQPAAVKFASAVFRGQPVEAGNVLYNVPPGGHRQFHADYAAAFVGLEPGDSDVPPYRHVRAHLTARWAREKVSALLENHLTDAEEIYFQTVPLPTLSSVVQGNVVKLLDKSRTAGTRAAFAKLNADWQRQVQGTRWWNANQPLTTMTLRETLRDKLSGTPFAYAESLFQQFGSDATTEQSGPAISDLYPALNLIERAVTDDDTTAIKRELEAFNNLVRDLRARDKEGKYHDRIYRAERQIRSLLDSRVRSARLTEAEKQLYLIYLGGGKLRDADELYRQKLLVQISGNEAAALAILKIVTTAWNTGTLASLERDAKDPPTDVENGGVQLRDAYSLDDLKVDRGIYQRVVRGRILNIFERIQWMTHPDGDPASVAAGRLHLELTASRTSTAEKLRGAFEFLAILKPDVLTAALERFSKQFLADRKGNPAEQFVDYLVDEFGLAADVVGISERVRARPTTVAAVATRARFVEASRHTGFASEIGGFLAAKFGGRDVGPAIQQSLRNLEALARDERIQPEILGANLRRAGTRSATELADREYAELKANVEVENQLKKDFAEWTAFAVEIGVRALLVGVFGPAGLAGLAIGLATVGGARVLNEGLLGANYDLVSPENIASLLTEVTGAGFEAFKLEKRIEDLLAKVITSKTHNKLLTGVLNKLTTTTLDGILERTIQGTDLPDIDKICSVIAGSLTTSVGKVLGDRLKFNVTAFTDFNRRWLVQLGNQFLSGPPPKAEAITSGLGQVFKLLQDLHRNGRDALDPDTVRQKFRTWLITTSLTGLSVSASFTVNKNRDASRRVKTAETHADVLADLAAEHAALRELILSLPPGERGKALLKLARDPNFGREKLARSDDPSDPRGLYAGENARRLLDEVLKLLPADGKVTDAVRAKVRNAEKQAEYQAKKQAAKDKKQALDETERLRANEDQKQRVAALERDNQIAAERRARAEARAKKLADDRLAQQQAAEAARQKRVADKKETARLRKARADAEAASQAKIAAAQQAAREQAATKRRDDQRRKDIEAETRRQQIAADKKRDADAVAIGRELRRAFNAGPNPRRVQPPSYPPRRTP